jgi:hypothetical protein
VGTADGGWLIAWISADRTVLFRHYDASGAPVGAAVPVDAAAFTKVLKIQARALADGGVVVAWTAAEGTGPTRTFLRRFDAAGAAVTDRVDPGTGVGAQTDVQVVPMPDGNFLAAWIQNAADGSDTLLARRLDAGLHAVGAEVVLQPAAQFHPYSFLGAASLSQGTALFAWAYYYGPSLQARWQVLDALGAPAMPSPGSAGFSLARVLDSVQVVPAATGFRIVVESTYYPAPGPETAYMTVIQVGSSGENLGSTESQRTLDYISQTDGSGCAGPRFPGVAAAGGEDGHYLLAYSTCTVQRTAPAGPPSNIEAVGR